MAVGKFFIPPCQYQKYFQQLEGNIYDPYKGISDLNKKIIKFIGNPLKRIEEDNLRLLRYFRFIAIYNSYSHLHELFSFPFWTSF